jgi:hypothetical protein
VVTPASFPDSVVAQPVETDRSVVVPSVSVKYSIWRRNLSEEASGFQSAMCLEPSARIPGGSGQAKSFWRRQKLERGHMKTRGHSSDTTNWCWVYSSHNGN